MLVQWRKRNESSYDLRIRNDISDAWVLEALRANSGTAFQVWNYVGERASRRVNATAVYNTRQRTITLVGVPYGNTSVTHMSSVAAGSLGGNSYRFVLGWNPNIRFPTNTIWTTITPTVASFHASIRFDQSATNHITAHDTTPASGEEVTFYFHVRDIAVGRVLVNRHSPSGGITALFYSEHRDLPTSVTGAFTDNPGPGRWRYELWQSRSLDPEFDHEAFVNEDGEIVYWPGQPTAVLSVSPQSLIVGEFARVTWSTEDATSVEVRARNVLSSGTGTLISSSLSGSTTWGLTRAPGTLEFTVAATNSHGTTTATQRATWRAAAVPSTDGNWSSLVRMTPHVQPSTDGNWSSLARMTPFNEPSTDGNWSSLVRMTPLAPSTDGNWSSLVRMLPRANSPPTCASLPSQDMVLNETRTINLRPYFNDPDGASDVNGYDLSFTSTTTFTARKDEDNRFNLIISAGNQARTYTLEITPYDVSGTRAVSSCTMTVRVSSGGLVSIHSGIAAGNTVRVGIDWELTLRSSGVTSVRFTKLNRADGRSLETVFSNQTAGNRTYTAVSPTQAGTVEYQLSGLNSAGTRIYDTEIITYTDPPPTSPCVAVYTVDYIYQGSGIVSPDNNVGMPTYAGTVPAGEVLRSGITHFATQDLADAWVLAQARISLGRPASEVVIRINRRIYSFDHDECFLQAPSIDFRCERDDSGAPPYISGSPVRIAPADGGTFRVDWAVTTGDTAYANRLDTTTTQRVTANGTLVGITASGFSRGWHIVPRGTAGRLRFTITASNAKGSVTMHCDTWLVDDLGVRLFINRLDGEDEQHDDEVEIDIGHQIAFVTQSVGGTSGTFQQVPGTPSSRALRLPRDVRFFTFTRGGRYVYRSSLTDGTDTVTDDVVVNVLGPTADSDWSSLVRMTREVSTDSDWSSLVRMELNHPPVCAELPDVEVDLNASMNLDLTSYLSDPNGDAITIEVSESSSAISISNLNTSAHRFTINGLSVGTATVRVIPIDEHNLRGAPCSFTVTVSPPSTDSDWSGLVRMTPIATMDGAWSVLDISPTVDGPWSTLLISPTVDGAWSPFLSSITQDGAWSPLLISPTQDGAWSDLRISPTLDSDWSPVIGPIVCDGEWSDMVTLQTQDGPWSKILGPPTEDGEWSELKISPTVDSKWSPIIGPIVCDSPWSPIVMYEETRDSEWSPLLISPTLDGAWSALLPSPTLDGPWSLLVESLTRDGAWSPLLISPTLDGPWSPFIVFDFTDSPWGQVSLPAYRSRVGSTQVVVYHSAWGPLSDPAYRVRPSPTEVVVYHSAWGPVSDAAYWPRHGPAPLVIYHSAWSPVSEPAYQPRRASPSLIWHNLWGDVSEPSYRARAAPLAQVIYHSEWSEVSNVATQERTVLSAIGGAHPFIHIYEARRGLVLVRRVVDHPTGDLFGGNGFITAAVNADRDDDRAVINPDINVGDLRIGDVSIDVYRTTDPSIPTSPTPYRFYLVNTEGTDPNFIEVYYDATPSTLLAGTIPYRIRITADSTGISFQRYNASGRADGNAHVFALASSSANDALRLAVIAVTPRHANSTGNRLSNIIYRNRQLNDWYYYHGVPEIYVSDPIEVVAAEDAFSYNGRDSANFQSPPHVGYASALVRQHQSAERPWFEELLNRSHVITGQRVHILLEDENGNFGKDFTGILQSPPLQHQDNIYDWRVQVQDPTTLMVQSFANSTILKGPTDNVTIGSAIREVAQAYANRIVGLTLDDVLDPEFDANLFPVPLAWFWTDYESERNIFQRLVNTQGPPASFYVNSLGMMVFTGCGARAPAIEIGGATGIPISQVVSFSDHVVDVSNDARVPVSLHGWILPEDLETGETVAHVYDEPENWDSQNERDRVAVQLFENYTDNAMYNLARGSGVGVVFGEDGTYRYRIRTDAPVVPVDGGQAFTLLPASLTAGTDYDIDHISANLIDVTMKGTAGAKVPSFQLLGAKLQQFRTIEAWTSDEVVNENDTRFSRYLYHYREFQYGGYNSLALSDAQQLADWVVRYYRKGIKTMTLQLFCSNHVQEALLLEPDLTPVKVNHGYGDGAPEQWVVRSRKRIYRDGHMWVEVVLDEDVMHSLGLAHSPLCLAYMPPDVNQILNYAVTDVGVLTYEDALGMDAAGTPLPIPQAGVLSEAPDIAATVLPIADARTDTPSQFTVGHGSAVVHTAADGEYVAGHFSLHKLEALDNSIFWRPGLRARFLSLWLVNKGSSDAYWAMMSLGLRGYTSLIDGQVMPAMYHFLRVRYISNGSHRDLVLGFVTPRTTVHDGTVTWQHVAMEQPWLSDDDAGEALDFTDGHVMILDWKAFPSDALMNNGLGRMTGGIYFNTALVSRNSETTSTTNVAIPGQTTLTRSMGTT